MLLLQDHNYPGAPLTLMQLLKSRQSSVMVTPTVYSHRITGRDKETALKWDEFQGLR